MLKTLEIAGFKSFAKKTELHFKSRITAIVGPNGSGKSNVAESFRFVLGEQSMKSMRGKRGEDMIWNGSNDISRANRASVKVTLDNTNNFFSAIAEESGGFDEISIERVVNRDGANEYYLNGSQVRLKDIFEVLAKAHIGSSGHHIISQGEADRILSANPKERREMIEDALGLKIYQYKREESERKLERTEENIKQVESLRREIAPHLKFLKKQVEKVEKAEELRIVLTDFYRKYLKREKKYIESERAKLNAEKDPIIQQLSLLEKEMEEAKHILENSSEKDIKSNQLLDIEDKIKLSRQERDSLAREIGHIEGEISANTRSLERLEREQKSEENKTILLREVEELEREITVLNEVSAIILKIRDFITRHKSHVDTKNLDEIRKINTNLSVQKSEAENSLSKIDLKLQELSQAYEKIKVTIEKDKDSTRDAEKTIFRISSEQSELRAKQNLIEANESRLRMVDDDFKREIQEAGVLLGTAIVGFENEEIDDPVFAKTTREESRRELEKMKIRLEELGGGGGSDIMKEYQETSDRDQYLERELNDLHTSAESLNILIKDLFEKLDIEFKQGIEKINKSFQEYFSLMFDGGTAQLKIENVKTKIKKDEDLMVDEDIENVAGMEIEVSLPRKRVKSLEMLSGGERALTSIALLFAISQVNPPPFVILDETDAALDEANSKKYGDMIENLSKFSQLILITHNRETMSRAGIIYGVTMGRDGVSRLLSIAFDEAVAVAK